MANKKISLQKKKGKKRKKENPSVYRHSVNLNEIENIEFQTMMKQYEITNISKFISACIFKKELKVILIDKYKKDYYMQLTNLYSHYQKIGVNYNQVVKAIHTNFGEERAKLLLYNLQKATLDLIVINDKIVKLTERLMEYDSSNK